MELVVAGKDAKLEQPKPINYQLSTINLVLTGFMGTGKSTLGQLCAERLGFEFCDSDQVMEAQAGCSIPELFRTEGEARFRQREREVIAGLSATPNLVIATGGGVVLDAENVQKLRASGLVVLLTAPPDVILQRVGNGVSRPLLADAADARARIVEMLSQRMPLYLQAAHCQVETGTKPMPELVEDIILLYELAQG